MSKAPNYARDFVGQRNGESVGKLTTGLLVFTNQNGQQTGQQRIPKVSRGEEARKLGSKQRPQERYDSY
jgi:hypothetical protein